MSGDPVTYLEGSFLSPLLVKEGVTDISYNGESLFYVSNDKGRQRSSIEAMTQLYWMLESMISASRSEGMGRS